MLILLLFHQHYSYEVHGFLSSISVSILNVSLFLMFLHHQLFIILWLMVQLINIFTIIDHSMICIAIGFFYTPGGLTLMNNWFGYHYCYPIGDNYFGIL